ncbi:helix-turn-helix domain-containing protein [Streptomyces sp. NPDC093970]|uniref:helix-turn-helix domain-containing protein n=1 Tax=Streptomyces sp. NPDC093970 TaxID=3155076 RepID=UPI00343D9860
MTMRIQYDVDHTGSRGGSVGGGADGRGVLGGVLRDRLRRASVEPLTLATPNNSLLRQACTPVSGVPRQPRSAAWLARSIGVSERTLARLFRREVGMTYRQWRSNVRVFHAMMLLAEGPSVSAEGPRPVRSRHVQPHHGPESGNPSHRTRWVNSRAGLREPKANSNLNRT